MEIAWRRLYPSWEDGKGDGDLVHVLRIQRIWVVAYGWFRDLDTVHNRPRGEESSGFRMPSKWQTAITPRSYQG